MYIAKICFNSVPSGPINFILGADIRTTPLCKMGQKTVAIWQHCLPSNRATKSAFYDGIYQKCKGL